MSADAIHKDLAFQRIQDRKRIMKEHALFSDPTLPWAIDMDGTLIREDVTELAVRASMQNPLFWGVFVYALFLWLRYSLVTAHRYLEQRIPIQLEKLTYNTALLARIKAHTGTVMVATASHVQAGRIVCGHVVEEVIGSDPPKIWDAKGLVKAGLLAQRFPQGFLYAGNSKDDLDVWKHALCKAMLLVNCNPEVLEQAQEIGKPYIVIP